MHDIGSRLAWLRDPRLAPHALSAHPAWVWSPDATRILWANPTAAAIFDAEGPAALAARRFDRGHPAAAQIVRLAASLPHAGVPRLERLRGFGAGPWRLLLCTCSRIALADRTPAVLVVATEPAGPNLSLAERLRRLLAEGDEPVAAFASDGALLHATPNMLPWLGGATSLSALGAGALAAECRSAGRAEGLIGAGRIAIEQLGTNGSAVLVALLAPQEQPAPDDRGVTAAAAAPEAAPPVPAEVPDAPAIQEPAPVPAEVASTPVAEAPPPPLMPAPPALTEPRAAAPEIEASPPAPAAAPPSEPAPSAVAPATVAPAAAPPSEPAIAPATVAPAAERRAPLRFVWQMDAAGRFAIGHGEFTELIGPRTAKVLGRPWTDIVAELALDQDGQVTRAMASRETWSGITVDWPVDGTAERLAVELSGLPIFDRDRDFRGYRGFGVCRDIARINALMLARREAPAAEANSGHEASDAMAEEAPAAGERPALTLVPASPNVVPFRATAPAEGKPAALSPVERKAFRELARQLSARLKGNDEPGVAQSVELEEEGESADHTTAASEIVPARVSEPEPEPAPAVAAEKPDLRPVLDRLPVGVLVYHGDQLLYANQALLAGTGYATLDALREAGGIDSLFTAPGIDALCEAEGERRPLTITTSGGAQVPVDGRLFSVPWCGEQALMLSLAAPGVDRKAAEDAAGRAEAEARELKSILDTATDGVIVLDRDGRILASNRRAEALFGYESPDFADTSFADLFAPESQRVARDYLDRLARDGSADVPNGGREVAGLVRKGGMVPLFMTMGRIGEDMQKFCAVFRDVTQWKKAEGELLNAKRQAEKASSAKSEFLAKISHEIRTPLNAIIGFSEVMMEERFGPIGNERYREYLKDIHSSGAHLVSLLNDLLDLSKIEAGKLELTFVGVKLNDLTQQCVALMQPQANRERIIIRSSLSPVLPQIVADARSIRQIVLNLLSNSIKFTGAGGQVIVSTAHADNGEVVLRVRDTGIGMSEKDVEIALEPFRQLATSARWGSGGTGLGLPLTKALAEANRARFSIKSAVNAGTLVEIAFPPNRVLVE